MSVIMGIGIGDQDQVKEGRVPRRAAKDKKDFRSRFGIDVFGFRLIYKSKQMCRGSRLLETPRERFEDNEHVVWRSD